MLDFFHCVILCLFLILKLSPCQIYTHFCVHTAANKTHIKRNQKLVFVSLTLMFCCLQAIKLRNFCSFGFSVRRFSVLCDVRVDIFLVNQPTEANQMCCIFHKSKTRFSLLKRIYWTSVSFAFFFSSTFRLSKLTIFYWTRQLRNCLLSNDCPNDLKISFDA